MLAVDTTRAQDEEIDLRAYLLVVVRRWKAIVGVAVLVVLAALGYTLQQDKQYRAESEVLIRQSDSARLIDDNSVINANEAARQLNNEVRLFESGTIEDAVDAAYDGPLDPGKVKAAVTSDSSDVLNAHLTATDPDEAAALVNLYVQTFIDVRRQQRTDELLAVREEIQSKIDELGQRITQASDEEADALRTQRGVYQSQIEDLEVSADVTQTGVQVLTKAEAPDSPVSPKPQRDLALALVLGLVLGIGLAFLIETLDERIRSVSDLERVAGGLPVLGSIPFVDRNVPNSVATRDDPTSLQAEAFKSLRTTVKFVGVDRQLKILQITSPNQGEGKTTAVANLAVAVAQGGERVVVACCDLRRPTVQERFGVKLAPGFTDVLTNETTLDGAVQRIGSHLGVLPAGTQPRNPSELLSSDRAHAVLEAIASQTDVLILDSTPVLPVTDALVVSRFADATIVIVDSRLTTRKAVQRTLQLLHQVNAPVIGLVLNGVSESDQYGIGYGYGRSYTSDDGPKRAKRGSGNGRFSGSGARKAAKQPAHRG